jgi:hypothetical protein
MARILREPWPDDKRERCIEPWVVADARREGPRGYRGSGRADGLPARAVVIVIFMFKKDEPPKY